MGEATVSIVVILILAGVAVFAWRSSRRPGHSGSAPTPPADRRAVAPIRVGTDLPTFNVIALGGQETGKTVLLASMFHRLTTEIRGGGFRLETSLDQSVHLTNLYAR